MRQPYVYESRDLQYMREPYISADTDVKMLAQDGAAINFRSDKTTVQPIDDVGGKIEFSFHTEEPSRTGRVKANL